MGASLRHDPELCRQCREIDCLTRCRPLKLNLEQARKERDNLLEGRFSTVLTDCTTCYACEEYCPYQNHPFYLLVDRQEELGVWPVPKPVTRQQILMMGMRGRLERKPVQKPLINMCFFPMLVGNITGRIFEGASTIVGSDVFCNIMWLHFGKNSVIRERLPQAIENIRRYYLEDSGVDEIVHFHDECYGTYTQLAPAFGIEVPFKSIHLFEFLVRRLEELKQHIRPLGFKVAYQRPCSNRLSPHTQDLVDDIFRRIGVTRVEREYDRDNALCCGAVLRGMQRDDEADRVQRLNLDDMAGAGAQVAVFNCPFCLFTLGEAAAKKGLMPLLMSDLCRAALGEK
ncbi:MAG: (Fe-S)-binding protein [Thermodesulfobacteriota bacterium]